MSDVYNVNMEIEQLIKQHLKSVYNFVYRIAGNRSEAEDITQEVFIKVWRNLGKFKPEQNLKPWIFAIARNTTLDSLRKRKNISFSRLDSDDQSFEETLSDMEDLPDEIFMRKELAKELEEALSKIRPDFKEIILLRYMEDLNFEEISEIVGKPLNTVKSHHRRALSAIRKIITTQ